MQILKGVAASPGYAIGRAIVYNRDDIPVWNRFTTSGKAEHEVERFDTAVVQAKEEIQEIQTRMSNEVGEGSAAIFGAHLWILSDRALRREVLRRINDNNFTAEYAVDRAIAKYKRRLRALDDAYLVQRVNDLEDIERRLLDILMNTRASELSEVEGPAIVVAHLLSPSQTASFDREKVRGIATDVGGKTGHAAILARDLGIPAVVGLVSATSELGTGENIIVDGQRGLIIIDPDERTVAKYQEWEQAYRGYEQKLTSESHLPATTKDGLHIDVFGNIEFPEEIPAVVEHGAEGIGLYRTEFLYLRSGKVPSEAEHLDAYRAALGFLEGRPILIRTLDLGADKIASQISVDAEPNPFLGCRSIRLCYKKPEMFRTQLRAILQVASAGEVKCMLPMITSAWEIDWAREVIDEIKEELKSEGLPYCEDLKIGIMIEVPAAALMANELAQKVDFFSIGTNDLVQYTLAVDRTNEHVASMFTPSEPSVLRLIQMVIDAANTHNIPVSMCGEMAGNPVYVMLLLGMGLRSFSVAPLQTPQVKKLVRSVSVQEAEILAKKISTLGTRDEIQVALAEEVTRLSTMKQMDFGLPGGELPTGSGLE